MKNLLLLVSFVVGLCCSSASASTTTYSYDTLDRLTKVEYSETTFIGSIAYTYDDGGNLLSISRQNTPGLSGDINGDGKVSLEDTVLGLQILCGIQPLESINTHADIDGDGKLGQAEVIYALKHMSEH